MRLLYKALHRQTVIDSGSGEGCCTVTTSCAKYPSFQCNSASLCPFKGIWSLLERCLPTRCGDVWPVTLKFYIQNLNDRCFTQKREIFQYRLNTCSRLSLPLNAVGRCVVTWSRGHFLVSGKNKRSTWEDESRRRVVNIQKKPSGSKLWGMKLYAWPAWSKKLLLTEIIQGGSSLIRIILENYPCQLIDISDALNQMNNFLFDWMVQL